MHASGVAIGTTLVVYGAGFSIGRHAIKFMRSKIRGSVAVANVIRDSAICFGVSYIGGLIYGGVTSATGRNVPVDFGLKSATANSSGNALAETANDLSGAANNLIDKVTNGAFDAVNAAGSSVGGHLTSAAAGTPLDGAINTIVQTLGTVGSLIGSATSSAMSAVIFGAVIGIFYSLLFDK